MWLPYDPLSAKGERWLLKVREVLANITKEHADDSYWTERDQKLYLGGTGPVTYDAIQAVYEYFPYLVTSTTVIVLVLVAVMSFLLAVVGRFIVCLRSFLGWGLGVDLLVVEFIY